MLSNSLISAMLVAASEAHPPLQFRVDTLIFSLIIFLCLLAVLIKYAWNPIMDGLDQRAKNIEDEINSARSANQQAQANLKQYEEKLAGVNDEASAIIADAKEGALAAKQKIVADAQAEAQRTRERALADIEAAKNAAVRELAQSSVDSAVSLAGNIVGRSLDPNDHSNLIEDSIKQFTSGA